MTLPFLGFGPTSKYLIDYLKRWSRGPWTAPTLGQLKKLTERDSLEVFLPWLAWFEEEDFYYLEDDSIGFLWECTPHCYTSDKVARKLESIFRDVLPENTVVSFLLHADDHIEPIRRQPEQFCWIKGRFIWIDLLS